MLSDWSAHVTRHDDDCCMEAAAGARTPEAVTQLRHRLLRQWPDDPRARELATTLRVHEMALAGAATSTSGDPPEAATTLAEVLRRRARARPHDLAYEYLLDGEDQSLRVSYGDLDRRASHAADVVRALGAAAAPVLLLFPPGIEYIAALFGCWYAGAVAVPVRPPHDGRAAAALRRTVVDGGIRHVLTSGALRHALEARLEGSGAAVVTPFDWTGDPAARPPGAETIPEGAPEGPADAIVQFTSGSTGAPRGVVLTHANLLDNLAFVGRELEITPADRMLSWLPPYHGMGLMGVLQPLYSGCPGVLMTPAHVLRRPYRWLRAISRHRVTISGGPNLVYDLCRRAVSAEQRAKLDLRCWQVAVIGGEPVQPRTLWQFSHGFAGCGFQPRTFAPCYGLAEAALMVTGRRRGEAPVVRAFDADALARGQVRTVRADVGHLLAGCGRPRPDRPIRIVRPDTATACGDDEVGEIWVSGPSVARGRWPRSDGSADPFGARVAGTGDGPFVRTGDLGFLSDGELFVLGRMRDVVTIRGCTYHPQDIEEVVDASHASLRPGGGAAFSVAEAGAEAGAEGLVVVHEVQPNTLSALDADAVTLAVRVALGETLGLHARDVVLLRPGGLPRTHGGRVHRRACRELYRAGSLTAVAPR